MCVLQKSSREHNTMSVADGNAATRALSNRSGFCARAPVGPARVVVRVAGRANGTIKLTGNLFLISLTAGLSDALALAKAHGIAASDIQQLFSSWNPGAMVPARLNKIIEGKFNEPSWELNMARKDAGLMLSAAEEKGARLTVIPAVAAVMDEWIAKGHGADDWSVIAKDSV